MLLFKDEIRKSVSYLTGIQNVDGGIPYNNAGSPSGVWTTCGVLWAINISGINDVSSSFYNSTLKYIYSNQNASGLMSFTEKHDMECIDATDHYILAMLDSQSKLLKSDRNRLDKAINGLVSCVTELGWGIKKNAPISIYSSALTVYTLQRVIKDYSSACIEISKISEINDRVMVRLMSLQHDDGGWGSGLNENKSNNASTALMLLALSSGYKSKFSEQWTKGIEFVKNAQNENGSWNDNIERDAGFTIIRQSTPYCILALFLDAVNLTSMKHIKGLHYVLSLLSDGVVLYRESNVSTWTTRDYLLSLCLIRNFLASNKNYLIELLDETINVISTRNDLEKKNEQLESKVAGYESTFNENVNKEATKLASEQYNKIRNNIIILQILAVVFALVIGVGCALYVYFILGITGDDFISILAIIIPTLGGIFVLIFKLGEGI